MANNRKSSIFIPPGSITSLIRDPRNRDMSNLSFKDWHLLMQNEHESLGAPDGYSSFRLWKWCYVGCRPCRWFDSIDYKKKICKCCLEFETFKSLGTILLVALFIFIFGLSTVGKEILPGGSIFFIFFLFFTSYLAGYIVMLIGLPPMLGNVVTGLVIGNMPRNLLPERDDDFIEVVAKISENLLLIVALIRAGLLLDLSRIKNRIMFIIKVAFFPFFIEFILVWIVSYFLLELPLEYAALQGSTLGVVSLASLTSIMEKNKQSGYGEDKHLSTVLIASSALNVIFSLLFYTVCIRYLVTKGYAEFWMFLVFVLLEIAIGLGIGLVFGILMAFFPDKRNPKAAILRVLVMGMGTLAIANVSTVYHSIAAGVIACLTMCLIASNMWQELGWHQHNNPVQYFYTLVYYICQPMVLSLVGFTLNFHDNKGEDIGLSIAVIIIGLVGRQIICFVTIFSKTYPTTLKEKLFICITWLSKGTIQVILAFAIQYLTQVEAVDAEADFSEVTKKYSDCIKRTSVIAILLTTPFVCFILTYLTPKLLSKMHSSQDSQETVDEERPNFRRRPSVKFQETNESRMTKPGGSAPRHSVRIAEPVIEK